MAERMPKILFFVVKTTILEARRPFASAPRRQFSINLFEHMFDDDDNSLMEERNIVVIKKRPFYQH
jgi:hypothetical protein